MSAETARVNEGLLAAAALRSRQPGSSLTTSVDFKDSSPNSDLWSQKQLDIDPKVWLHWHYGNRQSDRLISAVTTELLVLGDSLRSTRRTAAVDWLDEVLEVIERLQNLPDDWNSHGACPLQTSSAQDAWEILTIAAGLAAPKPFIYPSPEGGAVLEFSKGGKRLSLILEEELIVGLFSEGSEIVRIDGELHGRLRKTVIGSIEAALEQLSSDDG